MNDHTPEFITLPEGLPVPHDDGACDHLAGTRLPDVSLETTRGRWISLAKEPRRLLVVYIYPRTGVPGVPLPHGWNEIPGARGCTPQNCSFRDHHGELVGLGATVYGLSTQTHEYQREMAVRLALPYEVLSDVELRFARALKLPTFEVERETLIKRMSLIVRDGVIRHVFYPVFPPDADAANVVAWLRANGGGGAGV